ncbi:MAG: hypothetical protein M5U25_21240 [Planctomycetota bacterium]|nr:hypothetical protein [Planctomycetota bacterium]
MNTRELHLQRELRVTEHAVTVIQAQLDTTAHDLLDRAQLQAKVNVLERRAQTLRSLLISVNDT